MILGMGERGLTPRQRKFAELLASGSSKVDSFRAAYPSDKRSRATEWQGGKRVARLPQVRAEVERLSLQRSPHSVAAQAEHVAARLLELSKSADPEIALRAIAQWGKLADAGLLQPPPSNAKQANVAAAHVERARIIEELKALYGRALGPGWQQRNELVASINAGSREGVGGEGGDDVALINEPPRSSRMDEPLQSLAGHPTDQDEVGGPMAPPVLITELRGLYAAAGLRPPDEEAPLVVEVDAESEAEVTAAPAHAPSMFASNVADEETSEADSDLIERDTRLDSRDREPMFRREPVPGSFPLRYRRVRVS